jgi:hypothetical protein
MQGLRAAVLFLAASTLEPQQVSQQTLPLNMFVDRLYAYADEYRATLPSLSCDERIVSEVMGYAGAAQDASRSV